MTPQEFKQYVDSRLWGTFLAGARLYVRCFEQESKEVRGVLGIGLRQQNKGYQVSCSHLFMLSEVDLLNLTILGTVCGFLDGGDV